MRNYKAILRILAIAVLISSVAACAMFSGRESTGQYVDDTTITTRVKAYILDDPDLKVLQVNVETMQGVVQLSGFVDSKKSEAKAVELARRTQGVKSVKDDLVIRNK